VLIAVFIFTCFVCNVNCVVSARLKLIRGGKGDCGKGSSDSERSVFLFDLVAYRVVLETSSLFA